MTNHPEKHEPLIDTEHGGLPPNNLYDYSAMITEGLDGFQAITDEHVALFHQQGFLVIHNAFEPEAVRQGVAGLIDLIQGHRPDFTGVMYEAQARDMLGTLSIEQRPNFVRKLQYFVKYDERLAALADNPVLVNVITRLIGDEAPVMFQDMALIKPPRIGREKPWHQDMAYFNIPLDTPVVGAWIALDEAIPENGCMMVIPGTHQEGPVVHFDRRDWQICDTDVQVNRSVAVPLQPGGCLLFNGLLHHGTPPSRSDKHRWAVQYHYMPASVHIADDNSERLRIFGADGNDVYC